MHRSKTMRRYRCMDEFYHEQRFHTPPASMSLTKRRGRAAGVVRPRPVHRRDSMLHATHICRVLAYARFFDLCTRAVHDHWMRTCSTRARIFRSKYRGSAHLSCEVGVVVCLHFSNILDIEYYRLQKLRSMKVCHSRNFNILSWLRNIIYAKKKAQH